MYVQNVQYGVCDDLTNIYNMKYLFHQYLYSDANITSNLITIMGNYIDALSIDYDSINKVITIKIKKTSMKKMSKFRHSVDFYYPIFAQIFSTFFVQNKQNIVAALAQQFSNPSQVYSDILSRNFMLNGLSNITCVSDNIINIGL